MRDAAWLENMLETLWEQHFTDVERKNEIMIRFGRKSVKRLGSIVLKDNVSVITVTGYFADEAVPEDVVAETVAHELIHYTHGFSSLLEKRYKYPHQGAIIRREMELRGLEEVYTRSRRWMSLNWRSFVSEKQKGKGKKKRRIYSRSLIKRMLQQRVIRQS